MKAFAKFFVFTIICMALVLSIAGCASPKQDSAPAAQDSATATQDTAYQWGQLEQQYQGNAEDGTPVIEAKHFTIYSGELDFLAEKLTLTEATNTAELAAQMLIEKYAQFYKAQEAGLVVSDAELEAEIQKQIEIFSEAESADYDAFLSGLGMTNEEYWNSRKDELKISESIAAWKK